ISIDPNTSLLIVLAVLAVGILASVIFPEKEEAQVENQ
ncbi:tellurium resistance protein TerC, partial [Pseudomonas aeruginosa]|nr:tellurium resistance protein TerC [Pseudomonas aeruginosa]